MGVQRRKIRKASLLATLRRKKVPRIATRKNSLTPAQKIDALFAKKETRNAATHIAGMLRDYATEGATFDMMMAESGNPLITINKILSENKIPPIEREDFAKLFNEMRAKHHKK